MDDFERMHELEAVVEKQAREVKALYGRIRQLQERVTDMQAAQFADRLEMDMDLERWKDGIAAHVGHDLEDIADRIMAAIEADRRGENVGAELFSIHGDVVSVMADLLTMDPDEDAEA